MRSAAEGSAERPRSAFADDGGGDQSFPSSPRGERPDPYATEANADAAEQLMDDLLDRSIEAVEAGPRGCEDVANDIQEVVLVGGSTRIRRCSNW